jgi:acetyltransferase-like isoleucine patch superfamily enzyme
MTKPLIYLGSNSNLGVFNYVCQQHKIPIHGIVDDDYWGNTDVLHGIPVIGSELSFDFVDAKDKYNFFIAASIVPTVTRDTKKRLRYIDIVDQYGLNCQSLVDKESRVYNRSILEPGCFVSYQSVVSSYAVVKAHSQVASFANLGHHSVLGKNSAIERKVLVTGDVTIGDNVHIGAGVICVNHAGINIGDNSIVQPGIVLMRDVEPNEIVSIGGKNSRRIYKNVIRD